MMFARTAIPIVWCAVVVALLSSCKDRSNYNPAELEAFDPLYHEYKTILEKSNGKSIRITFRDLETRITKDERSKIELLKGRFKFFDFDGVADASGFATTMPLIEVRLREGKYVLMRSGIWRRYPGSVGSGEKE